MFDQQTRAIEPSRHPSRSNLPFHLPRTIFQEQRLGPEPFRQTTRARGAHPFSSHRVGLNMSSVRKPHVIQADMEYPSTCMSNTPDQVALRKSLDLLCSAAGRTPLKLADVSTLRRDVTGLTSSASVLANADGLRTSAQTPTGPRSCGRGEEGSLAGSDPGSQRKPGYAADARPCTRTMCIV